MMLATTEIVVAAVFSVAFLIRELLSGHFWACGGVASMGPPQSIFYGYILPENSVRVNPFVEKNCLKIYQYFTNCLIIYAKTVKIT